MRVVFIDCFNVHVQVEKRSPKYARRTPSCDFKSSGNLRQLFVQRGILSLATNPNTVPQFNEGLRQNFDVDTHATAGGGMDADAK
ncbi:hypothetical protein [Gemmatimonas sp. UBA7669]|uniref:hypothetical protein n=1 Tax=Gemmatimonas sp. UBA7669 TaxID=1946568 RepID=UPI0025C2C9C0|nr:hypothetical protein [Gemmatimonas sp. UBA7669]